MTEVDGKPIILVTGANKGIGFHVVKKFVEDPSYNESIILLSCRDLKTGEEALDRLGSPSNVRLLRLDLSCNQSIRNAVHQIKLNFGGHIDIVINNAAILENEVNHKNACDVFAVNYYGIKGLNDLLLPMMNKDGRMINVSSQVGPMILRQIESRLRDRYTSSSLTFQQLDEIVEEFLGSIQSQTHEQLGYRVQSVPLLYGVSKAALNSLTYIEAREWSASKSLVVVSVSPGFCSTDMTKHAQTARSPELGAESVMFVVKTPKEQLMNGCFYRDGKQLPLIADE